MPGGWSKDGAVQDQIDASVNDAVDVACARCQSEQDEKNALSSFNRRGSKDSQLR